MEEKALKKVLNILKEFTDKNCPKEEIRYVYYNSKRKELVSTDSIRMLVVEIDLGLTGNWLFDVNKKGLYFNEADIKIIAGFNAYMESNRLYPKYENVIPNKLERDEYKVKYTGLKIKDVIINIGSLTGTKTLVAYTKQYDKLNDIDDKAKIYLDKNYPDKKSILIKWKSDLTNTNWRLVFQPISK